MTIVHVRYFAVLRERCGLSDETIQTEASTVGDFVLELIARHQLGLPPSLIRVAHRQEFIELDTALIEGMELVLIPPVAGG